jgi:prepilin-type processing-associated H-X9-DG protein/prepilin-type N-terminal cleavage/methylation domain-containing protein
MKNKIENDFSSNNHGVKSANRNSAFLLRHAGYEGQVGNVFTLLELLIVIAIIAILAGLLLPALSAAKKQAHKIKCMGNQKQLVLSMTLYTEDWQSYFPVTHVAASYADEGEEIMEWWDALADYKMKRDYLLCPGDKAVEGDFPGAADRTSYVCNGMYLFGKKKDRITDCSKRIIFSERGDNGDPAGVDEQTQGGYAGCHYEAWRPVVKWEDNIKKDRHGKSSNYSFADCHVENLKFEDTVGDGTEAKNQHFVGEFQPAGYLIY